MSQVRSLSGPPFLGENIFKIGDKVRPMKDSTPSGAMVNAFLKGYKVLTIKDILERHPGAFGLDGAISFSDSKKELIFEELPTKSFNERWFYHYEPEPEIVPYAIEDILILEEKENIEKTNLFEYLLIPSVKTYEKFDSLEEAIEYGKNRDNLEHFTVVKVEKTFKATKEWREE